MTFESETFVAPYGWSPDGTRLVFEYQATGLGRNIGVLSMDGERSWEPLFDSVADEEAPAISPDGEWIAYTSDETGERLVYVERFPGGGGRETISREGSGQPIWAPDGRELYFLSSQGRRVTAVSVEPGPTLQVGGSTVLFEGNYFNPRSLRAYDLSPDGERFLRVSLAESPDGESEAAAPEAILVQGWFEELKRLVPIN